MFEKKINKNFVRIKRKIALYANDVKPCAGYCLVFGESRSLNLENSKCEV